MLLDQQCFFAGLRHGRGGGKPAVARADDYRVISLFQ
jgi:hypothetical protein